MKKVLFGFLAFLGVSTAATAQTINVADVTATPGQTVTATVKAACPANTYTGIRFTMQFPETGFSVGADAASGWNGSIQNGSMNSGAVKFAAAASSAFTQADIAVQFTVADNLAEGNYQVTVSDIRFEGSQNTTADAVTFNVRVVNQMEGCEVTVQNIEAVPGETVEATLAFVCPEGIFTGLRFGMLFPETGFTVGSPTGWSGSIEKGNMNAGLVKFAAAASSTFSAANIVVPITVGDDVEVGEYDVTVDNILFEGSAKSTADSYTFTIKVVASHVTELNADEDNDFNDWVANNDGNEMDVKVIRTLPAGEWSTIVLPFKLSGAKLKTAFGGVAPSLAYFVSAEDVLEDDNPTGIDVTFDSETTLYANTPMLVKVGEDYPGFIDATGVTIEAVTYEPTTTGFSAAAQQTYLATMFDDLKPALFGDEDVDIKGRRGNISSANVFIGTYASMNGIGAKNDFYVKGNKFYKANGAKSKPTRAFFRFDNCAYNAQTTPSTVRMIIRESNNETTGIMTVQQATDSKTVYNLQGQRVKNATKGLFIQNGKKIFKK